MAEDKTPPVDDKQTPPADPPVDNSGDPDAESNTGNNPPKDDTQPPKDTPPADDPPVDEDDTKDTDKDDKDDAPLDTDVWGTTNDATGDSVLQMLQNGGMDVEEAKAMIYEPLKEHGDVTKLDRQALVNKIGESRANLVLAGIENYTSKAAKKTEETLNTVYEAAGDKESWSKVAEWAKKNIPDADRADLNELLDAGGAKARYAASEYVRQYNASSDTTSVGKDTTLEGGNTPPDTGEAITKVQYAERLALEHRNGSNPAKIKEIQRARERGRSKGI